MQIVSPDFTAIEEIIFQVALARFGEHVKSAKNIGPAIVELSDFYNAPVNQRKDCPNARYHQAARMMFFTLADMPKAYAITAETDIMHGVSQQSKLLKVLDVGVGYGAQSLGVLSYLFQADHHRRIQLDVVDKDGDALETFGQIVETCQHTRLFGDVALNSWRMDLNHGFQPRDRYDIIIIGSALCELQSGAQYPLLVNLLAALNDSGVLIALEPALKKTSRNLHALRDQALAEQPCRILAPCTRQDNCPCLENDKDWCHESQPIVLPPRARRLSVATGLRMHDVKWSYMTLTRIHNGAETYADAWRVVGDLMKLKGKQEVFLCGQPGRLRAILQKRDNSPANKPFKKLRRGQLVRIEHAHVGDGQLILGHESSVSIQEPVL